MASAFFPSQRDGVIYLTEGGQETEIMYKHGHKLPEFAMFPLLDDSAAMNDIRAMYRVVLETAVRHRCVPLLGGLDYRASPDWASKIGFDRQALGDMQMRAIDFLRDVARPFESQLPEIRIAGIVGPRGDAYQLNKTITAAEAEDYHSVQLETLKRANVDVVSAMTFSSVEEVVGLSRAAARLGLPLIVSMTVDDTGRLWSGPSVREAIAMIDERAGIARPTCYGVNCSHPLEFEPALEPGDWILRVRSLRPNAALMEKQALCKIGHLVDGDPEELGRQMGDLARRFPHIDIWGGCCGTWERHLDAIARNVRAAVG
jgi:S-methylmethionine-dependent homocysteine/selenocysteine methylase